MSVLVIAIATSFRCQAHRELRDETLILNGSWADVHSVKCYLQRPALVLFCVNPGSQGELEDEKLARFGKHDRGLSADGLHTTQASGQHLADVT